MTRPRAQQKARPSEAGYPGWMVPGALARERAPTGADAYLPPDKPGKRTMERLEAREERERHERERKEVARKQEALILRELRRDLPEGKRGVLRRALGAARDGRIEDAMHIIEEGYAK